MNTTATTYQTYLLRLWREDEHAPWRAALENTHTGERITFADVEALIHYLARHVAHPQASPISIDALPKGN